MEPKRITLKDFIKFLTMFKPDIKIFLAGRLHKCAPILEVSTVENATESGRTDVVITGVAYSDKEKYATVGQLIEALEELKVDETSNVFACIKISGKENEEGFINEFPINFIYFQDPDKEAVILTKEGYVEGGID